MQHIIPLILAATLAGCAADAAVLRIVEYQADSTLAALAGSGIAVHQSGAGSAFARVQIIYQGERGAVQIDTAPPTTAVDQ